MDTTAQKLIEESAKYGFAMTILVVLCLCFGAFIFMLWKHQNKREEKLLGIIQENTEAFVQLQGTINTLTQMIGFKNL